MLYKYIVSLILFHCWPESQSASLPKFWIKPPFRLQQQLNNSPGGVEGLVN